MIEKGAIFSPCRIYRYTLHRIWNPHKKFVAFVGLNPSTADENIDDPTIRRCMGFTDAWGFGGLYMLNIFALRSTDPKLLYSTNDPIGEANDFWIRQISSKAGITVACWGNHGLHLGRGQNAYLLLTRPHFLKLTGKGEPGHPLYLSKDLKPKPWRKEQI